jgi:hypothetical protein
MCIYMISKLGSSKFDDVRHFFTDPEFDLLLSAIQEGNSIAQMWADDKSNPKSVLLWDKANNVFYLSGDENNR